MFDIPGLLARTASDAELAIEVLECFAGDLGRLESELTTATDRPRDEVRKVIHQLKGSALNVGAVSLGEAAARAEAIAADEAAAGLADQIRAVLDELGRCRSEIPSVLEHLNGAA